MLIEITKEELEIIENWYNSAAGESASGLSVSPKEQFLEEFRYLFDEQLAHAKVVKALVDKLGFEYNGGDEYAMKGVGLL